ncbi:WXG100 family type VII secretion target [Nonomuraea dietziae]|uniref:WXG100 family type VII secretion target n=1 Tax=Nonomuraea dietziae TaxID=65515 RepID=UPI00343D2F21
MAESIKKTHWLKLSRGEWTVDRDDRSVEEVKGLITGIRVKEIEDAGAAYTDAYAVVDDVQWALGQEAQALAKVWEGKASVAAQKALRTLYLALGELARKLLEMGHPLVTLADVVRQHQAYLNGDLRGAMKDDQRLNPWSEDDWLGAYVIFNGVLQSGEDGLAPAFGTSRDEMAGRHLETFSKDLEVIYDRLPDKVEKELPALAHPVEPLAERKMLDVPFGRPALPGISSPSASDAGPAPTGLSGGSPAGEGPTFPGHPHHERPHLPGHPDGRNGPDPGREPGLPSPDAGPGMPSPDAGSGAKEPDGDAPSPSHSTRGPIDPANGPDGPTRAFGRPAAPPTELADFQRPVDSHGTPLHATPASPLSTPASPLSTPTGPNHSPATTFGFPGSGTDLGSAQANGRAAASHGMGSSFMPMSGTGGAGGQEEQDRETGTWLHEDDDGWSGDVGGVVDSRIG